MQEKEHTSISASTRNGGIQNRIMQRALSLKYMWAWCKRETRANAATGASNSREDVLLGQKTREKTIA